MSYMPNTLGIILAAGTSSRLYPATLSVTKQLLPVYDKPLIYYPLSTLMLADIRRYIIIVSPDELQTFQKLFFNAKQEMGIDITFLVQDKPTGIADAFNIVHRHLGSVVYEYDRHVLILGDNIFYGAGLSGALTKALTIDASAHIFLYHTSSPENFGVVEFAGTDIRAIEEKPKTPKSNYIVTGMYVYPPSVYGFAATITPSHRNELEITDMNMEYLRNNQLTYTKFARGMVWFDTGDAQAMLEAANFIQNVQHHQHHLIGSPHEIALNKHWVSWNDIQSFVHKCRKTEYGKYLKELKE